MIISHRYQFIFVKTFKTAGTSIEVYLSDVCGPEDVVTPIFPSVDGHLPRNYEGRFNPLREIVACGGRGHRATLRDWRLRRQFYNHLSARKIRARVPRAIWRRYFKFCVERNPWDKTLSHFHMARTRGEVSTLDSYFDRGEFCTNLGLYTTGGRRPRLLVDRVLDYGSLNDELQEVFASLGVPYPGALPAQAKSLYRLDRRPYQQVLTDRQRTLVQRHFRQEIELHGYQFQNQDGRRN